VATSRLSEKPEATASVRAQERGIADQLRRVYGAVLREPVPEELKDLIRRIAEKPSSSSIKR
jgi:hypothetical protein